ncbi:MAG TPA: hypothetical protein PLR99_05410 [Polyangiaceae bacterium]|nr:hypothetical protein [Polyangiaceae bacterium]
MGPSLSRSPPLAAAALVALVALAACGRGARDARPVYATAGTMEATLAFEELRDAWERRDVGADRQRVALEQHIKRFPTDGTATTAQLYLAFLLMQAGEYYKADSLLALLESTPRALHAGPERDMFSIARAKSLRQRGAHPQALALLQPLAGKAVDETLRGIFLEELSLAALGAGEDYEAIGYMDAWLRGVSEDKRVGSRAKIAAALEGMPAGVLEATYRAMRTTQQTGYSPEIQRLVAVRVAAIVVENEDATLARWLLDVTPGGSDALGDSGPTILELAASRRGLREVQGRTVGLLLSTGDAERREAAAAVLRGVSWALELPKAATERADAIRLVVRTDASEGKGLASDLAMEELFGEGAGVVIAGLDGRSADHALKWGEAHGLPVVLLHPPARQPVPTQAGYVIGEARPPQAAVLAGALAPLGDRRVQLLTTSRGKGREAIEASLALGGLGRARDTVDCDVEAPRPGMPRFPYEAWAKERVRTFVVAGARECLTDTLAELKLASRGAAGPRPLVGVVLDTEPPSEPSTVARVFAVSAGILPLQRDRRAALGDPEVAAYYKEFGQVPGWWAALGRDAGILARQAVSALPSNTTADPKAVAQRHAIVAAALGRAQAPLWTTEASGFAGQRVLARSLRVVELK